MRSLFLFPALLALVAYPAAAKPVVPGSIEVDRIEITGGTVFTRAEIEASVEIGTGEALERKKIVRTAENLQNLYRLNGYEEVRVQSELERNKNENGALETTLRFKVAEGRPTRIASVVFEAEGIDIKATSDDKPSRDDFRDYWERIRVQLPSRIGIVSGDVFKQEKITAAKRAVQDTLAFEEFIGARIEEVSESIVEGPGAKAQLLGKEQAAKWVSLKFRVNLGDRVSFGFRGNTVFTKTSLLGFIEEQRAIGFGKDYIGAIAQRIEDEYKARGYTHVRVEHLTFERAAKRERHVTFVITESQRVRIDSIQFDGNTAFNSQQLRNEFVRRGSLLVSRGYYVAKDVDKASELLVEWMKSQGYLAAKVVTINRTFSEDKNSVRLLVYIYEGSQTTIQGITLKGVKVFSGEEVRSVLGIKEGDPLNLYSFSEGIEALKAAYRGKGYLEVHVENEGEDSVIKYSRENRYADVYLEVSEGYQYRVSRIEVDGLSGTKPIVVMRELQFKEDDILFERSIAESESRLWRLGIFSSINISGVDDPQKPGYRIVRISVAEGTPGIVAGGMGYRNDLGVRAFGQLGYTNVWHQNHSVAFNVSGNKRINEDFCSNRGKRAAQMFGAPAEAAVGSPDCFIEYQAQIAYTWPWFALGETTFKPSFTFERTQYVLFDTSSLSLAATWERRLMRSVNLTGLFTYSLEKIRQFNSGVLLDDQDLRIGSITPALRLDLRDNSLAPTSGFFSSASFEIANPALLSRSDPYPIGYTRFQFRADGFIPLAKEVVWYLSFRTGMERNTELAPPGASDSLKKQYQIPLSKQFSLGGAGSLRGFSEQELNAQNQAILGTLAYTNYRTQIDLPFAGALRFGPFLDAGQLYVDWYSLGMLRFGAGVGFHYQSPVGPVNFDWGFKLDPKPGEDPYRFYFSIGVF